MNSLFCVEMLDSVTEQASINENMSQVIAMCTK